MVWAEHLAWVLDHGKSSVTTGFYWGGGERVVIVPILQMKKQKPTEAE